MIIVKLTVLAVMVTALYIWRAWLKSNTKEALKIAFGKNYIPKSGYPIIIFLLIDIIGVFVSTIYLLFFR